MKPPKPTDLQVTKLAREIVGLKRQIESRNFTPQLGSSSIEDGAIQVNDLDGALTGIIGKQHDGTTAAVVVSGPPPPVPAGFSAEGGQLSAVATWDGSFVDGVPAPMDYAAVEVHRTDNAVMLPDPYIGSGSRVGTITTAAGASLTFAAPQGDSWLWLIARAQSGKFSEPAGPLKVTVSGAVDPAMFEQLDADLDAAKGRLDAATAAIGDDAGNITAASVAAKTGAFIKLDVNQLTATGTSNLNSVVAQRMFVNLFAANKITANEINASSVAGAIGDFITVKAENIEGGLITASIGMWANGQIVAGNWNGSCAAMSAQGFLTKQVAEDGSQYTATTLGNPNGNNAFALFQGPNTPPVAEITQDGEASFIGLSSDNDPVFEGRPLLGRLMDPTSDAGWLDDMPQQAIAYGDMRSIMSGKAVTGGSGTTTPVAIVGFVMMPGRLYQVSMPYRMLISAVSGTGRFGVDTHYTYADVGQTDPAEPTTSSTHVQANIDATNVAVNGINGTLQFNWPSPFSEPQNVKLLVSVYAQNCTVQTSLSDAFAWQLVITDVGPKIEDSSRAVTTGGSTTPAKKTYTTTWTGSASRGYDGSGNVTTFYTAKKVLGHGYWSSSLGNNRSAVLFNSGATAGETGKTMATALAGATITKAELFVQSVHWGTSSPSTARFFSLGGNALPSTITSIASSAVTKRFTAKVQGFWITVPTSWFSTTSTGIIIGPAADTSQNNYGYFASHDHGTVSYRPKVRLTYTR